MRKQDFIRLQRTYGALRGIERRLSKVWERTYCRIYGYGDKSDDVVDFKESPDDVLCDINTIEDRVACARSAVENLLAKAYERKRC